MIYVLGTLLMALAGVGAGVLVAIAIWYPMLKIHPDNAVAWRMGPLRIKVTAERNDKSRPI